MPKSQSRFSFFQVPRELGLKIPWRYFPPAVIVWAGGQRWIKGRKMPRILINAIFKKKKKQFKIKKETSVPFFYHLFQVTIVNSYSLRIKLITKNWKRVLGTFQRKQFFNYVVAGHQKVLDFILSGKNKKKRNNPQKKTFFNHATEVSWPVNIPR